MEYDYKKLLKDDQLHKFSKTSKKRLKVYLILSNSQKGASKGINNSFLIVANTFIILKPL